MKKSEKIAEIAKALSECQKDLKDVYKASQGHNYKYASLDKVYDEIRPKMTLHGLSLTHQKSFNREANLIELVSMLMHISGEWIEYYGSLPFASMKQMNDYQASGSGFTYLERYQTSAIFAITADEDKDAQGEQETGINTTVRVYKPASKANDDERLEYKKEFMGVLKQYDADALDFFSFVGIDHTSKNDTHNAVVQYLRSGDLFIEQLEAYSLWKIKQNG